MTPSLSVVVPVYNEPSWIRTVVDDLVIAAQRSPFTETELVIVDDGSDEETRRALATIQTPLDQRVIRQDNAGRFAARRTGVEAARGDLVLLLDSRVSIRPDALEFVAQQLTEDDDLPVWNAHVDIDVDGNPYARFWNVLTEVAFADYFANPRTTSYGLKEFDRFPKGTTCFLAPRARLLEAIESFDSRYEDLRDANDDTILIRTIAEHQLIHISPGFSCVYRSRDALRPFLRHAFHRGGVFLDGYGRRGSRFFPLLAAFFPSSVIAALVGLRRPRLALAAAAGAPLIAAAVGAGLRRPRPDIVALATLGPAWLVAYAAGIWRGGLLAVRSRLRR